MTLDSSAWSSEIIAVGQMPMYIVEMEGGVLESQNPNFK